MNTLTWKKHQEIHEALVIHLINMCNEKTGMPPSVDDPVSDGLLKSSGSLKQEIKCDES